jgi:protein associated with RNAse G/E
MDSPKEGEFFTIKSYKHNGKLHRIWQKSMVLKINDYSLIGFNDHTLVIESNGRRWVTHEPAILYFHKKYWFNIIVMLRKSGNSYYCNLASPYVLDKEALKYIDYDLDIKIFPNKEKLFLDVDEYEEHRKEMHYPWEVEFILKEHLKILVDWIENQKGPFSDGYIKIWQKRYEHLKKRIGRKPKT